MDDRPCQASDESFLATMFRLMPKILEETVMFTNEDEGFQEWRGCQQAAARSSRSRWVRDSGILCVEQRKVARKKARKAMLAKEMATKVRPKWASFKCLGLREVWPLRRWLVERSFGKKDGRKNQERNRVKSKLKDGGKMSRQDQQTIRHFGKPRRSSRLNWSKECWAEMHQTWSMWTPLLSAAEVEEMGLSSLQGRRNPCGTKFHCCFWCPSNFENHRVWVARVSDFTEKAICTTRTCELEGSTNIFRQIMLLCLHRGAKCVCVESKGNRNNSTRDRQSRNVQSKYRMDKELQISSSCRQELWHRCLRWRSRSGFCTVGVVDAVWREVLCRVHPAN